MSIESYTPVSGTLDDIVSVDSGITTSFNSDYFEIVINASQFADEIYTLDYINNVFLSLQCIFDNCQNLVNSAKLYITNADAADQIQIPNFLNLNFNISESEEFKQVNENSFNDSLGIVSISSGTLNLRSGAGTNTNIIGSLSKNTKLKIINNDTSSDWVEVETEDGKRGFVFRNYLKIEQSKNITQSQQTTKQVDFVIQKVSLNSGSLNVRSAPNTNNTPIGSLQNGEEVKVLEIVNGWAKIEFNNQEAYVSTKYLSGGKQ